MRVHVYRNRPDDDRGPADLHFCKPCGGWYGVPHTGSHCQKNRPSGWGLSHCACAFCRLRDGQAIEGAFGFVTDAEEWQP